MGKLLKVAIAVVLFVVLVCAALYLETLLVEAVWNELIADSMGWKPLTRDAAFGIVIFLWFFTAGMRSTSSKRGS